MRDYPFWRIDEQAQDGWRLKTHITTVRVGQTPAGVLAAYEARLAAAGRPADRPLRAVLVHAERPGAGGFERWFRATVAPHLPADLPDGTREAMVDELLAWSFLFVTWTPAAGQGPGDSAAWHLDADAVVQALPDLLAHLEASRHAATGAVITSIEDWLVRFAAGQLPPAVIEPAGRDLPGVR